MAESTMGNERIATSMEKVCIRGPAERHTKDSILTIKNIFMGCILLQRRINMRVSGTWGNKKAMVSRQNLYSIKKPNFKERLQ